MNHPSPRQQPQQPAIAPQTSVDDEQVLRWLKLRRELTELHARLEYLKLMVSLGVSQ